VLNIICVTYFVPLSITVLEDKMCKVSVDDKNNR